MPSKGGLNEAEELPVKMHPYEAQRLRQCMRNNARLQQLGIPACMSMFKYSCITSEKNKSKRSNHEDSGSEYEPEMDGTGEGDFSDDNQNKGSKKTSKKRSKTRSSNTTDMAPGGIRPRPAKRVFAEQLPTRATRSKQMLTSKEADASGGLQDPTSVIPSDSPLPTPSQPNNSQANLEEQSPTTVQDHGLQLDEEQNHMLSEEGSAATLPDIGNQMGNAVDGVAQIDDQVQSDDDCEGEEGRCIRGLNMGKGLQKMSRARRGKLPVVILDGRIRPVVPLIAAKFATECNIAVRNHVPVLKHWKEYKSQDDVHLKQFMGKLVAKFDMDTRNDSVKRACTQMMKNALRQQRYRLKKRWFDPYPLHLVRKTSPVKSMTHEQWNDLVESWKDPKKMAACEKNKANRAKVKFHQTTGSRSYVVHLDTLGDKYNNEVPNGLDYFKECHYSNKKKGYTPSVQSAITEMENMISEPTEGEEQPKSANEVVADYLAEHTKQPKFLQNVGIQIVQSRSSVKNVEAQLAAEKMANADLRSLVTTQRDQIEVLTEQLQEEKQARVRDKEEMQKKQAETDAKLDLLLSRYPTS